MNDKARMLLRFALFFGTMGVLSWISNTEPGNRYLVEPLTKMQVVLCDGVISLFGGDVRREGTSLVGPLMVLNVKDGCNGIVAMILFASAVIAHSALVSMKLLGLGLGLLSILAVNLIRIITLFIIATIAPDWLEFFHVYFWQTLLIILVVLFWYAWASRSLTAERQAAPLPE